MFKEDIVETYCDDPRFSYAEVYNINQLFISLITDLNRQIPTTKKKKAITVLFLLPLALLTM